MTWSKIVPASAYVLAHRQENTVRIQVNSVANADLDPEAALSLGSYLTEKAGEILAESVE